VKSKDFELAIKAYSRSLEINGNEPFTFANRAMAYLKMKNFKAAVSDATKAIEYKPGYLKAYHRRGKANHALNNY
jgi:tetratricopeptide (TPR) repeat protein